MMKRTKIVIVGGGSNAWAPNIVKDMLLTEGLRDAEIVLFDINKAASDLVKAFVDKLQARFGARARIVSTDNRAQAFRNANYFLITISTGGHNAMAHDLAIPEEYGIYHTVGDTSGPGGWARCLRNYGVFKKLAEDIARYAPGAMVLNYSNPMTMLTDILCRLYQGPVVGLCHALFENLAFIKHLYRLPDEAPIAVQYGGVNHFIWTTVARAGAIDVIADLKKRLVRRSFDDLWRESHPDLMGFASRRYLATELFRLTGVLPYLGDRHTCEFFPGYITSRENLRKYRLVRTTIQERRAAFRQRDRNLRRMSKGRFTSRLQGDVPDKYLKRSRETAADIIAAHALGKVFIDVGNVPNIGQIDNLPRGAVLETAVRVDRNGFTPLTFGSLPPIVLGFVEPYVRVFARTVDACRQGDRRLALQALRLDPLCSHLNTAQVLEMGRRLMQAHADYLTEFR